MIMTIPRMTIFIADFALDCFSVMPRKAPIKDRRKIPVRIEMAVVVVES